MTNDKAIEIKKIVIIRAEGKIELCGIEQLAKSWKQADEILLEMSETAPKDGGYDKTDFYIEFVDGQEYEGRYDLKHFTDEIPNLYNHVVDHVSFYTGLRQPHWMEEYQYQALMKDVPCEEYKEFLFKYLGLSL
jgi:hypothetical protein